jgi:hypothetical protein
LDKTRRASIITNRVMALDEKWGKDAPPQTNTCDKPSRLIADECRWHAQVTREHQEGPDGELWDLIQVWAHGQLRMTAVFRGEELIPRLFKGGPWEALFNIFDGGDPEPLLPNDGTK